MNLRFTYLYRDGANYKHFKEIIFSNPNRRSTEDIEPIIKRALIDEAWFVAKDWSLPDLHFTEYPWTQK